MRVFVNYISGDPAIANEKLCEIEAKLKPYATVFISNVHNKKGKQFRRNIELFRSDLILQLLSPNHLSEIEQKEIVIARKKNKPIIKITVDELLNMNDDQVYQLLSDVEKEGWPLWLIMAVSLLLCVGISLCGIWLSYRYVSQVIGFGKDGDIMNARGLFGDSWGGVNAIISAFAFAGVIVTLYLQNRDLNLQRKEMARQREEFEKENETLKYQRFENLFYNMLNLQQEIVAGLKFEYEIDEEVLVPAGSGGYSIKDKRKTTHTVTGREVFRYTFEKVELLVPDPIISGNEIPVNGYRRYLKNMGLSKYDATWIPTYFDHYFRHLYKIIQFVDSQGFPYEESYKYISLLRGTLSRYELIWIYYNALNPLYNNFKKLIEKYSLLKNIREDLLTKCTETRQYYEKIGLAPQVIANAHFTASDFEFFLTDNNKDDSKYYLTAFWKQDDIQKGQEYIDRWKAFVAQATE